MMTKMCQSVLNNQKPKVMKLNRNLLTKNWSPMSNRGGNW